MSNQRSIDILLATYNGQAYLGEQIDSILAQSNQDWRLIIRDDASDDDTLSIVNDYVSRYSDRITLIEDSEGRLGASLNFQRLLEESSAEYIMFCDQDDVWLPGKIAITLDLMKTTEQEYPGVPVLVHTDLTVVDSKLKTIAQSTWRYQGTVPETANDVDKVLHQNVATGCTMMINEKAKMVSTPIPPEAVMHDWWIVINVAKHGRVAHVPQQLVLYRQHSNNAVGAVKAPRIRTCIWAGLKNKFSLPTRIMNHYRMVRQHDPNAAFLPTVLKKIASKLRQRRR
ncbi:MAG: glycosyltransferase family 2 protein [Phycisphaerae bacterium]|jgi:glycosyltransferase involved in cell wall biosynthesis|nr:glycosyltransferase family 2 protein [Phycisphaerae bacterium]